MHKSIQNLILIKKEIDITLRQINNNDIPKIIAVSKTFPLEKILPIINHGHKDFGENKVQEAVEKWSNIKLENKNISLHLIGKLQTNKVRIAVKLFDYIHSVENEKLAKKIAAEQINQNKKIKIFIQVNIGNEYQKSGVQSKNLEDFYQFCKNINLDVIGLMCIPPQNEESKKYFLEMNLLRKKLGVQELSMGMSSDYLDAVKNYSTYLRIGSGIFGSRS
jgi:pyridoxal phosphate enzyme (YggS family)|tara:strand:+ start:188 stop:847 length:660 start_codon:yes stop_codon:yes gene_type:complete